MLLRRAVGTASRRSGCRERRQIADSGDGHFDGSEAISGEVVDADTQVVCSFDGDADLPVERIAGGEDLFQCFCGDVILGGGDGVDDERAVLIVDVDTEFKAAAIEAAGRPGKEDRAGICGEIDQIASIGAAREL
jgi:hypothetical protein